LRVETQPGSVVACNFCGLFFSEERNMPTQNGVRNLTEVKRIGFEQSPTGRTQTGNRKQGKQ